MQVNAVTEDSNSGEKVISSEETTSVQGDQAFLFPPVYPIADTDDPEWKVCVCVRE